MPSTAGGGWLGTLLANMALLPPSCFSVEANSDGRRWVLGEAGKDLLDDCQVECLHLGPILVDVEGGKVIQLFESHVSWVDL